MPAEQSTRYKAVAIRACRVKRASCPGTPQLRDMSAEEHHRNSSRQVIAYCIVALFFCIDAVVVEVAEAELVDKISVLDVKRRFIKTINKLSHIHSEFDYLYGLLNVTENLEDLYIALTDVNIRIWRLEEAIRKQEHQQDYDSLFMQRARLIYFNNDERGALKRQINNLTSSRFIEEKYYRPYDFYHSNPSHAELLVVGHWGLGDLIGYSGLVRYLLLSNNYSKVNILVPKQYFESVQTLYDDVKSFIRVIAWHDNIQASKLSIETAYPEFNESNSLYFGFYENENFLRAMAANDVNQNFMKAFYRQCGIKPDACYSHFYLRRNLVRERVLYNSYIEQINGKCYVIIHEDPSRNYFLNISKIPESHMSCHIIRVGRKGSPWSALENSTLDGLGSSNIFDYSMLIERATAFHGYDGAFLWLIEMLALNVDKYVHIYVRSLTNDTYIRELTSNWKIVE